MNKLLIAIALVCAFSVPASAAFDLKSAVSASHDGIVLVGGGHGGGGHGGGGSGGHMGGGGPGFAGHNMGVGFAGHMGGGPELASHMGGGGAGFADHTGGGGPGFASPTTGGGRFAWHNVGEIGAVNDHFDDNDHFKIVHNPNFDHRRFNNFVGGDTFIGGSVNNCWVWWPEDGWVWQCS